MTRTDRNLRRTVSRRAFLGLGLGAGAGLLAACGRGRGPADALAPTPSIDDGDDDGPEDLAAAEAALADEVRACSAPTAASIEGPFYKAGAPQRAVLVRDVDRGDRLALAGLVTSTDCRALAGATMQVWQADHRGAYDLDGYQFRGVLRTDADGRWDVATIIPGRYLNGSRYRPAHLHIKLRAPGHRPLTTQLYFEGDPYNDGDPFLVPSLIMPLRRDGAITRARFDFVLAPS